MQLITPQLEEYDHECLQHHKILNMYVCNYTIHALLVNPVIEKKVGHFSVSKGEMVG